MQQLIFVGVMLLCAASMGLASCMTESCHADIDDRPFVHGPVGAGMCVMCHGAAQADVARHESSPASFDGFSAPGGDVPLCQSCHTESADAGRNHVDMQGETCLSCHDPHGGANRFFVREPRASRRF